MAGRRTGRGWAAACCGMGAPPPLHCLCHPHLQQVGVVRQQLLRLGRLHRQRRNVFHILWQVGGGLPQ